MKKAALSLLVLAASGAYVWSQWNAGSADPLGAALAANDISTGSIARAVPTAASGTAPLSPQVVPFVTRDAPAPVPANSPPPPAVTVASAEPPPLPAPNDTPADTNSAVAAAAPVAPAEPADTIVAAAAPPVPPVEPANPAPQPAPSAVAINIPMPRLRPAYQQPAPASAAAPPTHVAATSTGRPLAATPIAARIAAATGSYADGTYNGPVVDAYYGLVQIQAIVQGNRLARIRVLQYPSDRRTSVFINRQALPMLRDEVIQAQSANVDIISGATLTSRAFIRSLGSALNQASS